MTSLYQELSTADEVAVSTAMQRAVQTFRTRGTVRFAEERRFYSAEPLLLRTGGSGTLQVCVGS